MPPPKARRRPDPSLTYEEAVFAFKTVWVATARLAEEHNLPPLVLDTTVEERALAAIVAAAARADEEEEDGDSLYMPATPLKTRPVVSTRRTRSARVGSQVEERDAEVDEPEGRPGDSPKRAPREEPQQVLDDLDDLDTPHDVRALLSPKYAVELLHKEPWVEIEIVKESSCWRSTSPDRPARNLRNSFLTAERLREQYHHLVPHKLKFSDITKMIERSHGIASSPSPKLAAIARITIASEAEMQQLAEGAETIEASHLCGEPKCVRPEHIVFEPAGQNRGREECHAGPRECTHTIRCLTRIVKKPIVRAGGSPTKTKGASRSAKRGRTNEEATPKAKRVKSVARSTKGQSSARAKSTDAHALASPAPAPKTVHVLDLTGESDGDEGEIDTPTPEPVLAPPPRGSRARSRSRPRTPLCAQSRASSRAASATPAPSSAGPDTPRDMAVPAAKASFFGRSPSPSLHSEPYIPIAGSSRTWSPAVPVVREEKDGDDDTQVVPDSQEAVDAAESTFAARFEASVETSVKVASTLLRVELTPVEVESVPDEGEAAEVHVVDIETSSVREGAHVDAEGEATKLANAMTAKAEKEQSKATGSGWWSWWTRWGKR
ncbi:hypothetical protein JCM3770_002037 [Rhodotorula araucariae]